jgi:hypothetical protein
MTDWLVAVPLFWFAAALYFGGFERDIEGGTGFRQFVGLMLSYVIFLVIWGVLHAYVAPESALGILIASLVAGLALPLEVRLGFLAVGARVRHNPETH